MGREDLILYTIDFAFLLDLTYETTGRVVAQNELGRETGRSLDQDRGFSSSSQSPFIVSYK